MKPGKKQWSCECGKIYGRQTSLWNHRTYHCGKTPAFSCPFCDHKTFQKGNLKVHIAIKHKDLTTEEVY